jgi:RES domain
VAGPRTRKQRPPTPRPAGPQPPRGLYELDSFTAANLRQWTEASRDLEELHQQLHHGTEPQRHRLRPELLDALRATPGAPFSFESWFRLVSYQFTNSPLSTEGSLRGFGGRFNQGRDLDGLGAHRSWPALYLAEDHDTAFYEKYQLKAADRVAGLSAEDLALTPGGSHSAVRLRGQLSALFRLTSPHDVDAVTRVLRQVKLPARVRDLERRLFGRRVTPAHIIASAQELYRVLLNENWRILPAQFEIPSRTHVIAELIRAAGFEGILYKSTKGLKHCLAVFPDQLRDGSFIELQDPAPNTVLIRRLDSNSTLANNGHQGVEASHKRSSPAPQSPKRLLRAPSSFSLNACRSRLPI